MSSRRKKAPKRGLGIIAAVVLIICGIVSYNRIGLNNKHEALAKQLETAKQENETAIKEQEDLQQQKAYVQTKKFVEDMAREKLGLVYRDEIIFQAENK